MYSTSAVHSVPELEIKVLSVCAFAASVPIEATGDVTGTAVEAGIVIAVAVLDVLVASIIYFDDQVNPVATPLYSFKTLNFQELTPIDCRILFMLLGLKAENK